MRAIQGSLIIASTLQIVLGFSGLWRNVARLVWSSLHVAGVWFLNLLHMAKKYLNWSASQLYEFLCMLIFICYSLLNWTDVWTTGFTNCLTNSCSGIVLHIKWLKLEKFHVVNTIVIGCKISDWCKFNSFLQVLKSTFSSSFGISCWFWAIRARFSRGKPYYECWHAHIWVTLVSLFNIDTCFWHRLLNAWRLDCRSLYC